VKWRSGGVEEWGSGEVGEWKSGRVGEKQFNLSVDSLKMFTSVLYIFYQRIIGFRSFCPHATSGRSISLQKLINVSFGIQNF
jgi:hypothetical protein